MSQQIITLDQAKSFCQIGHSKEDALIPLLIEAAEEWVARFCTIRFFGENSVSETVSEEFTDGGLLSLWPLYKPISDVSEIYDRETEETYDLTDVRWTTSAIYQIGGGDWAAGRERWRVTYKAGYDKATIPVGLKLEILNMIKRSYDNRGGLKADSVAGLREDWQPILDSDMTQRISLFSFRKDFF